ncbi:transcription termination factor Rho [Aeromicrobium massiliense]|uniref:transcription termination factor Rho n=1 Tax=Aeromicrobium massiliense TaxID=1464554 RepID=UPI0002F97F75|nr:transcription termination factor Rho [Aeromicrobium massiliense]
MTDTIDTTPEAAATDAPAAEKPRRTTGGLAGKKIAELQEIASGLGVSGAGLRKSALIDAIKAAQGGAPAAKAEKTEKPAKVEKPAAAAKADDKPADERPARQERQRGDRAARSEGDKNERPAKNEGGDKAERAERPARNEGGDKAERGDRASRSEGGDKNDAQGKNEGQRERNRQGNRGGDDDNRGEGRGEGRERNRQGGRNNDRGNNDGGNRDRGQREDRGPRDDDDFGGGNRRGRNRNRNRNRNRDRGMEVEPTYTEDDVLVPAAGILDILDNYAFVRTTGYLPSENDVYVSLSMARKWGLRKGDAIVGQVRQPREGERKEKFNPMVRIDSVNGMTLEESKSRVEFGKLTPLYPSERLRLERDGNLAGRVIDLVSPIGKGQRGLIVSPPKAGKTMIMQSIANAITENNPECHLMIVLVDERPEEVTDFQRTVKGEVISSTFDRPASDHTTVAELAIERAKRLVELGHDVVVLLDGITRLGRAYNIAAPASGRIMSGGVDSSALYPPKKFFGAARNIEDGGSLTILATALVETGSRMDEVIFEEFKGTGNMELRLRRDFADKRIFPAIDVLGSSTRREELLMAKDELAIVWKLRRVLSGLEGQAGLELVLDKLKKSASNAEFLMQISKTMPGEHA